MFPEYSDLIAQLKTSDDQFAKLVDKHARLDEKVKNMVFHVEHGTNEEIEALKKEKLLVKDQVFARLKKATAAHT